MPEDEDKTVYEAREETPAAGGDERAREYVSSRWGTRPRDERDRLASAFRAGMTEARRPSPSRPEDSSLAPPMLCTQCGAPDHGSAACQSRPEDRGARCVTCGGTGWLDFDETIGQRRLCPDCPPPRDPAGEVE